MNINAVALQGTRGWPELNLRPLSAGLNILTGPAGSGKTTLAKLVSHVLYGKLPVGSGVELAPEGEAIVDAQGARYRLRRHHDGTQLGRLTVAALDGQPVDSETVRRLVGGLPRDVLQRYYAVSFQSTSPLDGIAAAEFVRAFHSIVAGSAEPNRNAGELAARRDALAKELETRIARERRLSAELDHRRRELEREIRDAEQNESALELRLRAVETALAETDARLRYRRLELNTELRWQWADAEGWEPELAELDAEIARWRAMLADLAQREATVRSRLAQITPGVESIASLADQRAWIAVARQLAADLDGEVARLARASTSQQCVCSDAHPRLRPIVETLARQLDQLTVLVDAHQRTVGVKDLAVEAEKLSRTQTELRSQIEHLLDRRQALVDWHAPSRRRLLSDTELRGDDHPLNAHSFSVADAEQLEQRRLDLEQQRFELVEAIRVKRQAVRTLRSEQAGLDRQQAALLSVRSIEQLQHELSAVQRTLEEVSAGSHALSDDAFEGAWRASDFLAQLTNGQIVRLEYAAGDELAWAIRESGARVPLDSLTLAERDLVRLSFTLSIASAGASKGARLPVVLDDPFGRLDGHAIAAVAAVLDAFSRDGRQVLLVTNHPMAIDRLGSLGATFFDLVESRRWNRDSAASISSGTSRETVAGAVDATFPTTALNAAQNASLLAEVTRVKRQQKRSASPRRTDTRRRNRGDAA